MDKRLPNTTLTTLDLKIISCDDLKAFNFSRKLNTYVTVSIIQDDDRNPKQQTPLHHQKTPTDRKGHRNPKWNHSMQFDLRTISDEKVFLKFNVMCDYSVIRDWKIGESMVPARDLQFDGNLSRLLRLSVKNSDGKGRGYLNVSYKLSGERKKIEEDKIVQMKSYSSMKYNTDTVIRLMQTMEWRIRPSVPVSDVKEEKILSPNQICKDKGSCPWEAKSMSFNTGLDHLGKNYKKYGISGSTKWEFELDPRADRFRGLLVRSS